jgi:DNA-binding Xre family transcriptional regulator
MQIRMKITTQGKQLFLADFQRHMSDRRWNISQLARRTGIHQSQISRIAAGNFKTFASNVVKICMELGMEPMSYYLPTKADEDKKAIVDSAIAIWDGTHRDAEVVVSLLREIAKLRKHARRG